MITIPWYWRLLNLIGLLGLIALILIWNLKPTAHVQYVPLALEFLLLLTPLVILIPGTLKKSGKVYVLSILISLIYMTVGFLSTGTEPLYGYMMLVLSIALYGGSFMCAKVISTYNKAIAMASKQKQQEAIT